MMDAFLSLEATGEDLGVAVKRCNWRWCVTW